MRTIRFLVLICLSWGVSFPFFAQELLGRHLQKQVEKADFLKRADAGILVYDLTDSDKEVFSYRAEKLFRPASVEKLLTCIAALSTLDSLHTFDTRLTYTGLITGDTLTGNLYVKGYFDPLFDDDDLHQMADAIRAAGIHHLKGKLIGDVTFMDSLYWGPGWAWDDTPETYQPYLSPLMLARGCVDIYLSPRRKGEAAAIRVVPESDYYHIDNRTQSHTRGAGRLNATRNWLANGNTILLTGNVTSSVRRSLNLYGSKEFFLHTLRHALMQKGISIPLDSLGFYPCPTDTLPLYHNVHSLHEVIKQALKTSDNLAAEAIGFHVAARHANGKSYLGFADSQNALKSFVKKHLHIPSNHFRVRDASGMSGYNYVSPTLVMRCLQYAYRHPAIFNALYDCLPIAGTDGTLIHRMQHGKAFRNVRAKTGTLSAVSSLAGYVQAPNGHLLAFVILTQNALNTTEARAFQDRLCEILASTKEPKASHETIRSDD